MKTIIERGASWTLEETKLLLTLWGQDQVSRKDTPHKRTKEVYEKISEKFNQNGFERTPDQVRTRVFNMIAEYRRLLKDPNPERMKKCIFFDAMHKIYQAQHWSEVKSLIDDYEPETPFSPASNSKLSEMLGESISDSEAMDGQHYDNSSMDASNASNSVSNNNNTNAAASRSATNNDTTNSATTTTSNNNTNNSSTGGGINNKTSATSDNIANNSINDNHSARKNYSNKDGQLGAAAKRIKVESPKPGTSQGETNLETNTVIGEGKPSKSSSNNSNVAGSSSASNAPNSSSSTSSSSSTNNSSSSRGKQQSLLATSSSSTTSTPVTKLTPAGNNSTSYININSTKLPIIRSQFLGHSNGNESININGTQATTARLPTTAAITSHQLYQAPVNTFDVTSSALLIDRMFAHLSRESENMREWIALEKDRIALEKARRAQETEREIRREKVLIDTLMKFHEQWISFVSRLDPRLMEGAAGQLPELNIPSKETDLQQQQGSSATSQTNQISSASTTSPLNASSATSTVATSAPSSQLKGGGSGSGSSGPTATASSTGASATNAASSSTAST